MCLFFICRWKSQRYHQWRQFIAFLWLFGWSFLPSNKKTKKKRRIWYEWCKIKCNLRIKEGRIAETNGTIDIFSSQRIHAVLHSPCYIHSNRTNQFEHSLTHSLIHSQLYQKKKTEFAFYLIWIRKYQSFDSIKEKKTLYTIAILNRETKFNYNINQ